jgi:coatomer subunit beta'
VENSGRLAVWRFDLAKECFERAGDLSVLMLLLMVTGDRKGLEGLAAKDHRSDRDVDAYIC